MAKKIGVFCGSSFDPKKKYLNKINELISRLVPQYEIVYGGSNTGYMQAVAQQVVDLNGTLIGIMPKFLESKELRFEGCSQWIETESMNTRKEKMFELSDCFIALPGGVGTYEEIIDVISWTHIGLINKPIVLYNIDNFFNGLVGQIEKGIQDGFILESLRSAFLVSDDVDEIIQYLDSANQPQEMWDVLDINRKVTAKVINRKDHDLLKEDEYHLVVFMILRKGDQVLLELRGPNQEIRPNVWDLPAGSVLAFENSQDAIVREIYEELGLDISDLDFRLAYQETFYQSHCDYYELTLDSLELNQLRIDYNEVIDIKFFTYEEVLELIDQGLCVFRPSRLAMLFPKRHII